MSQTNHKTLLIIEDNPFLNGMYQIALEKAGFEVLTANDGRAGLALIREKKPDAIILDLLMPGMNGYEVLESVRKDENTRDIKVVVLTVVTDKENRERAEKLGISGYIIKSQVTLEEIVKRIKESLKD